MVIGVPKEIKTFEFRVAITPEGVSRLVEQGHQILIERKAGQGAGWSDAVFRAAGAKIVSSHSEIYQKSDLVLKVKEPQPSEYHLLRPGLILLAFLHLAANERLARILRERRVTALAYELVKGEDGARPILSPMSEIAGALAPLIGANYLRKDLGGKGALLSPIGLGGTGHVTIIGAGHVGSQALKIAHGLGASASVYDIDRQRLEGLKSSYPERLQIVSDPSELPEILRRTDLLIGAVLSPGRRAARVISKEMVKRMEPGSVVIDVSVDEGGCVETIHPTTLRDPVYKRYGVLHYGVTNIPSLVPRTATEALSAATFPYLLRIANEGLSRTLQEIDPLSGSSRKIVGHFDVFPSISFPPSAGPSPSRSRLKR